MVFNKSFLRWGNVELRQKILKNWTEISDKKSDGVKKLKLLVQITVNMYEGGQESSSTASAYSSLLFGAVFQYVGDLAKSDGIMNTEKHHQILTYHEITARRFLIQWLEKEKKKSYLDWKTHNGTSSLMNSAWLLFYFITIPEDP